jgi:L-alanine-DL-glutamate epimerase-like enolase superfamily enzyme
MQRLEIALQEAAVVVESLSPWDRQRITAALNATAIPSAVLAGIDMALYDWMGKRLGVPLWQLWGLDLGQLPPTSVTIGISSPVAAQQRAADWMQLADIKAFKVKLGSPEGMAADQAMLMAIQSQIPLGSLLTVDANGGWDVETALSMCDWLAGQGVTYVEQPLAQGKEDQLYELWHQSPLPIFVDESCFTSADLPGLVGRVHGINIKLMKCGGLTEAVRMIHAARVHGLQVMLGCYGNTALANTAAAHLAPLVDYLDLDSHLNLIDDPFSGAVLHNGCLVPTAQPGLGVKLRES